MGSDRIGYLQDLRLRLLVAKSFDLGGGTNPIIGLDPIGVETAPSDGAVQKVLLPEAAGSASGDFRESLWFASFPFSSFSLLLSLNFSICLLMIALFPLHNSAHECISSVTFFSTLCKLRGS